MKTLMKNIMYWIMILFVLAACSNKEEASGGKKNSEQEEITLLWSVPMEEETFNEQIKNPVEEHFPYMKVKHLNLDSNDLEEAFAANTVPDIIQHASHTVNQLIEYEVAFDMTELIKKNNFDLSRVDQGAIEFSRSQSPNELDGALLSMPFSGIAHALYYNKDLFDQFSVDYPEDGITWTETLDLARKLSTEKEGTRYRGLHLEHPFRATDQLEAPPIDRETGDVMFDKDEKFKRVLNMVKEFAEIPSNFDIETDTLSGLDPFLEGTTAMMAANDGAILQLINPDSGVNFDWDLVTYPVWEDHPTTSPPNAERQMLAISTTSEHKDDAFQVIDFMLSDEHQAWRSKQGFSPTVLVNSDVQSQYLSSTPELQEKNIDAFFMHTPATRHIQPPDYPLTRLFTNEFMEFLETDHRDTNVFLRELTEKAEGKIADYKGQN